ARIARVRFLLYQCLLVPHQEIPPRAGVRLGTSVDYGDIAALGLTPFELVLEVGLRGGIFREQDQAGGVLIDAVHHQRPPLAVRTEALFEQIEDRRHAAIAFERHRQQSGRLVDGDQTVVLEDDVEVADDAGPGANACRAGTVGPDSYAVAG